jgi:hypothetical protein
MTYDLVPQLEFTGRSQLSSPLLWQMLGQALCSFHQSKDHARLSPSPTEDADQDLSSSLWLISRPGPMRDLNLDRKYCRRVADRVK